MQVSNPLTHHPNQSFGFQRKKTVSDQLGYLDQLVGLRFSRFGQVLGPLDSPRWCCQERGVGKGKKYLSIERKKNVNKVDK